MTTLVVFFFLLATGWTLLGLLGIAVATRRPERVASSVDALPPVTVLKPLCGHDPSLQGNLESFFLQSHPNYELVFGVEDPNDPAIVTVMRLAEKYPKVRSRIVCHSGLAASNPKVRNLLGMMGHASHDLFVISDSNVRVDAHYLEELVRTRLETGAGIVTSVIAGTGETSLGGALESAQLNGFCATGACIPTLFGDAAVIGKSMLMSRKELADLGGLSRVADVLAEDFVLGKMFQHGGRPVVLARTIVQNVTGNVSIEAFFQRHRRWATLRWRLRPAAFVLEPLLNGVALSLLAWTLSEPLLVFVPWAFGLCVARDVAGWVLLRGTRSLWIPVVVAPVREGLSLAAWLIAPWKRRVTWRGHLMKLGAGTLLFRTAEQG